MRRFAAILAFFFVAAVCAQEPHPEDLFRDAQLAQQAGNNELAIQKYRQLLTSHPEVVAARANLGAALAALGRYDEAVEQYNAALKLVPGNRELRMNRALAYYKAGRFSDAAEQLTSLHQSYPDDTRTATLLGDCLMRLGRLQDVIALLLPLESTHPHDLDLAWVLGSAMINADHPAEGLKRAQMVAEQRQSAEAYKLVAQAYLQLTSFAEAELAADEAIRLNPNLSGIYTLRGIIADYEDNLQAAVPAFQKAIAANRNDFQAQLYLGAIFYIQRKIDAAREHLDRAIALQPDSFLARYELARVEILQGQLDAAAKNLELAAQAAPEWLPPHIELAALYYRLRRPEDGAREKLIVERISERERQNKTKAKVISPSLPSP
jgi:tetratricopeptide (TPR) repeat protein